MGAEFGCNLRVRSVRVGGCIEARAVEDVTWQYQSELMIALPCMDESSTSLICADCSSIYLLYSHL